MKGQALICIHSKPITHIHALQKHITNFVMSLFTVVILLDQRLSLGQNCLIHLTRNQLHPFPREVRRHLFLAGVGAEHNLLAVVVIEKVERVD